MYEVLLDEEVKNLTEEAMKESGRILRAVHPNVFTQKDIEDHVGAGIDDGSGICPGYLSLARPFDCLVDNLINDGSE